MVITNKSAAEAWIAVAFFAAFGGASWLVGREAQYVLAGI
jgi:hypothetical protein